ncbi:hypothetical protein [Streptomyces lucensis]|nr:hypothetical protein [Streptomyces lucensis]
MADVSGLGTGQAGSQVLARTRFQTSLQSVGQGPVGVGTAGCDAVAESVLREGGQYTG